MEEFEDEIKSMTQIFTRKIEALLSNCESMIEKKFLVKFLDEYYKHSVGLYNFSFLQESLEELYAGEEYDYIQQKSTVIRYKEDRSNYLINEQLRTYFITGLIIKHSWIDFSFKLIPQYNVKIEDFNYRLDFAILGSIKIKDETHSFNIGIECDGHQWHHTKEQIENDNRRLRNLHANDWYLIRYSGREINRNGFIASHDFMKYIENKYEKGIVWA